MENGANIVNDTGQNAIRISRKTDIGLLAEMNRGEIVLVDITDDPDVREVGDGKGVRRAGIGDASGAGGGYILRDDVAGSRGIDLYRRRRMVFVDTQHV